MDPRPARRAFYCKIDIEGNDHLCLEGIDAADKPRYISVEMALAKGDRDLSLLHALAIAGSRSSAR